MSVEVHQKASLLQDLLRFIGKDAVPTGDVHSEESELFEIRT